MTSNTAEMRREKALRIAGKAGTYALLGLWALIVLFPFYWMLLTSLKGYGAYNAEYTPKLFTLSPTFENYETAFTAVPLGKYFLNKYVGEKNETVYLLLLNNNRSEIDCIKIHRGSVNSAAITTRTLAEAALFKRASMAVLAHNHPNGLAFPSPDDIHTTPEVKKALGTIDVDLIAHIIVGQGAYTDVMTFLTNT